MTVLIIRGKCREKDTQGECYVTTEAEIGVMHLQIRNTKDYQELPEAEGCMEQVLPQKPPRWTNPADTLI